MEKLYILWSLGRIARPQLSHATLVSARHFIGNSVENELKISIPRHRVS